MAEEGMCCIMVCVQMYADAKLRIRCEGLMGSIYALFITSSGWFKIRIPPQTLPRAAEGLRARVIRLLFFFPFLFHRTCLRVVMVPHVHVVGFRRHLNPWDRWSHAESVTPRDTVLAHNHTNLTRHVLTGSLSRHCLSAQLGMGC